MHGVMKMTQNKELTDRDVELLVQAFLLPPPCGFTEAEKKQILNWVKNPSIFLDIAEKRKFVK